MAKEIALAEMKNFVGTELGVSDWITVDQTMIDAFAKATLDEQFIHTDPERAKAESPFGGTIAHGFLTLSLLSALNYDALPAFAKRPWASTTALTPSASSRRSKAEHGCVAVSLWLRLGFAAPPCW